MRLNQYYSQQSSIQENIEELVLIDDKKRNEINILVINIILKYLTLYLEIKETSIQDIKNKVHELLEIEKIELSRSHGDQLFKKTTDKFGTDCLLDIRQTSAIFKEIALDDNYIINDEFRGLDLGSGSGILTLAMCISGMRKGAEKGEVYYIDQSVKSIGKSTEILEKLSLPYNFNGKVGNILDKQIYSDIPLECLSYLVSETIGNTTPSFSIDPEDGELVLFSIVDEMMEKIVSNGDPFPSVVSTFTNLSPILYQRIKKMQTGMFPNFLTKKFIPDDDKSKLLLKTGISKKLELLKYAGEEFSSFEDLSTGSERWTSLSDKEIMNKVLQNIFK